MEKSTTGKRTDLIKAHDVFVDFSTKYIKNWTQQELKKYINQPVVIPIGNYGFFVGRYRIQGTAKNCWSVKQLDGKHIHDFVTKSNAILYCVKSMQNKSNYLGKDQYEEFGGGISNNKESIIKNAIYELREETANMINIKNEDIFDKYLDLKIPKRKNSYYRCYYLRIDQMNEKIFNKNLNVLKKNKETASSFLEMDEIVFIPISNFFNSHFNFELNNCYYGGKELFINVKDIDNKIIRISERTTRLLLNSSIPV